VDSIDVDFAIRLSQVTRVGCHTQACDFAGQQNPYSQQLIASSCHQCLWRLKVKMIYFRSLSSNLETKLLALSRNQPLFFYLKTENCKMNFSLYELFYILEMVVFRNVSLFHVLTQVIVF